MAEQITRRDFIRVSAAAAAMPVAACVARPFPVRSPYALRDPGRDDGLLVNDVHSQLNAHPRRRHRQAADGRRAAAPRSSRARSQGKSVSIAGGRHAMGGQQFGEASVLLDMRALNRVLAFDAERGVDHRRRRHPVAGAASSTSISVQAGSRRPAVGHLSEADRRRSPEHRRRARRATRTAAA